MNILLLSMPNSILAFQKGARFPNLGLMSLAGNIEPGHTVAIADLVLCQKSLRKYLLRLIKKFSPTLIGLSCYSFQYDTAIQIAKLAKALDPTIKIVLGGYHPTLWHEKISEPDLKYVDFIVRNEGEKTFHLLVNAIDTRQDFSNIAGLSYKAESELHHNPAAENLDLEELKLPNRETRILSGYHAWGLPCDVIETSRGCTYDCTFCTITKMYGRTFRRFPTERFIADIQNATRRGAKAIFMVDDNITLNMHHFEEVCDAIIASKLNHIHYSIQASVRGISKSKKIVDKMAHAGFKTVFLGIENVNQNNLDFFGKDNQVNHERTEKAVAYLRENDIIVLGATIVGNPNDTEESIWENFHYLKKLKVDGPLFFTPTPLPQTKLRGAMMKHGLLVNAHDFSWYMGNKPICRTNHLSPSEISRIVLEMNNKFLDLKLMKNNRVRKHYPNYIYRRIIKEAVEKIGASLTLKMGFHGGDPLRAFLNKELKRREQWLLGDLNRNCSCWLCAYARGDDMTQVFIAE